MINHRRIIAVAVTGLFVTLTSYAQTNEVLSFTQNTAIEYSTKGNPKAGGLHITLRYPSSWRTKEGNRPHIVQKFVSAAGSGFEMCALLVVASPEPISEADAKAAVETTALREYVPPNASFISGEPTTLDGLAAGIIAYKMTQQTAGQTVTLYSRNYMTVYDSKLIQLQCAVGDRNDSDNLARRFNDYSQSVFALVANSLVVQDKWAIPKAATSAPQKRSISDSESLYSLFESDHAMFYTVLAISFLITWCLGLSPALIARYAIYKRPLSKTSANWIAGLSCFVFAILFMAINAADGQRSHAAVWVLVFFVSRWIMTRETKSLPDSQSPSS